MKLKVNEMEFDNIKDLLGGFITTEQDQMLKFNMVASPDLAFNTAMQLLQSMTYQLLFAFMKQKPEAANDIYDAYNFMASSILDQLIPGKQLRPDIDEEAILELEIKKIEAEYDKLTPEQKAIAIEKIEAVKNRLNDAGKKED